jgi:asparagine synthase (glutamine-hydrolysing)
MEAARAADVPVLFFGHGGDELFWGYRWTVAAVSANLRKKALLNGDIGRAAYMRPTWPALTYSQGLTWLLGGCGFAAQARAWRSDSTSPPGQMIFWNLLPQWHQAARSLPGLVSPNFLDRVAAVPPERQFTFASLPERPDLAITDLLLDTYLLGNGIAQADRLSMSTSVECRLPFVDYRLVETVFGLRMRTEDYSLPPKHWLRGAATAYLPQDVMDRPKRGFTPPYRRWSKSILRQHGEGLIDGVLAEADILRNLKKIPKPVDALMRTNGLAMSMLTLEMWARGMRNLEQSAVRRGLRARVARSPSTP